VPNGFLKIRYILFLNLRIIKSGLGISGMILKPLMLSAGLVYVSVQVPYDRGDLAALFHEQGTVVETSHAVEGTILEGYLPRRWLEQYREYLI